MKILKVVNRTVKIGRELDDLAGQGFTIDRARRTATKGDLLIVVDSITDERGALQYSGWNFDWAILDELHDNEAAEFLLNRVRRPK